MTKHKSIGEYAAWLAMMIESLNVGDFEMVSCGSGCRDGKWAWIVVFKRPGGFEETLSFPCYVGDDEV